MQDYEWLRQSDTCIRYYFKENPDLLTDTQWAMRLKELEWIRGEEAKANKGI